MNSRKSIMFIDEHKIVDYAGGAEKVICNFANEFVSRGYDVSIVCLDQEKGMPLYALDQRVRFINLCYSYGNKNFGGAIWFWKKVEKELLRTFAGSKMVLLGHKIKDPKQSYYFEEFVRRLQACILEVQPTILISISTDGAFIAQQAVGEHSACPVIAMCNTDPLHFFDDLQAQQLMAWQKCRYVQVLMASFKAGLEDKGLKNVIYIPNEVMQVEDNEICDLTVCHNSIITMGRIDGSAKRQHLLIEAFSQIAQRFPTWNVYIYGNVANKRYKKRLDRLIRDYHLDNRVIFKGVTKDVVAAFRQSDIFAFPSEYEGFGLAMTEAMSAGVPVVACKECRPAAELVKDGVNGCLADGVDDFAVKLSYLMERQDERIRFGANAHEAMKEYAPKQVWQQWAKLLAQII